MNRKIQAGKINTALTCPCCGSYDCHFVVSRSERRAYYWDVESQQYFQRTYGQGIQFRSRIRNCNNCHRSFEVVELTKDFLGKLIRDVMRLQKEVAGYRASAPGLEHKAKMATGTLRAAKRLLAEYDKVMEVGAVAS